ncbi:MAG: ATP-dependent RNA helicase HrpA, partial [Parcubacteria group bacterium SW_4_49_11]
MNLPVNSFRQQILESVAGNPVTIITAETGAGKSTQAPQFLLEAGYSAVCTQPRRLAARTVAERVAEEMGENLGQTVGYRTAVDRQDGLDTQLLFCTDGLALVRELMGQNEVDILLMDEVHEWNENVEVLLAWAKQQIDRGENFKLVLMSATLESEKLSEFFDGAPVIDVPGRLYPVEERQPRGKNPEEDVASLVKEGRNVLLFQPGTGEIQDSVNKLQNMELNAEVLPLHGQLDKADQQACFQHFSRPKVVCATNVAQTSVTIDDIDAVVDTGKERRKEVLHGVEGLYLRPISLADAKQRQGRAGRTRAGVYIDWC